MFDYEIAMESLEYFEEWYLANEDDLYYDNLDDFDDLEAFFDDDDEDPLP